MHVGYGIIGESICIGKYRTQGNKGNAFLGKRCSGNFPPQNNFYFKELNQCLSCSCKVYQFVSVHYI
jgi:hypothetical protein